MSQDHSPITIENFMGLWRRGYDGVAPSANFDDETPLDHFCDGLNFDFFGSVIGTRAGARKDLVIANVTRVSVYRRVGEAVRLLILTYSGGVGNLYDSTSLGAPILTINGMIDFASVVMFNRVFISPHNGVTGLPGEKVYLYDGTTCRAALGAGSVNLPTVANGSAGSIELGTHLIAVCGETASGFITPPTTPVVYTAPGNTKCHITNIATGPSYWVARRIIATQVITYNGNPLGYVMYFVPNGRIADNVTTTLDIDFFDSQLISSADYLFSELSVLPAGVFLTNFVSRLVSGGENASSSLARVSGTAEPESFSSTDGFIVVDPSEVGGVTNGIEFRSFLYLTKGTHTYAPKDNGSEPSSWDCPTVDNGIGTPSPFGISQTFDNRAANLDYFVVASVGQLYLYNGIYVKPELGHKVDEIWQRINKLYFYLVQVWNDTQNRKLYITLPLDGATAVSHVLVGDYVQGLNMKDIRFALWSFPFTVSSVAVSVDPTSNKSVLRMSGTSNLYTIIPTQATDDGTTINCFVRFYLAFLASSKGWIHHFFSVIFRTWGSGTLNVTMQGEGGVTTLVAPAVTLSNPAGKEEQTKFNFQNEKCSIKIQTNSGSDWFKLKHAIIYAKALWSNRPQ